MPSRPSPAFTARYDSICDECGGDIRGDVDEIVMLEGEAIHEDCAPTEPRPRTFPI